MKVVLGGGKCRQRGLKLTTFRNFQTASFEKVISATLPTSQKADGPSFEGFSKRFFREVLETFDFLNCENVGIFAGFVRHFSVCGEDHFG